MQSLELYLQRILLRSITLFLSRPKYSAAQLPIDSFKRILIVRQHDQLGDLLIATPAIRAVRKRFPNAFIAVVAREYTAPILECNPYVDEVITFYEKLWRWNIRKAISFWRSLRGDHGFECAIVLNTISRSLSSDLIALLSRARYIVGSDHLSHDASRPETIYNVISHRSAGQMTEISRNIEIVQTLGAEMNDFEYDLVLKDAEVIEAERNFQTLIINPRKDIVGVHFGALNPSRCFPLDILARIIDWTIENYDVEIVLIVSPNEIQRREYLVSQLSHKVHFAPVMPLRVMAAFMRHLSLFICNDTGTLHIASSQRVPTVSFHSSSDPAIWKPPHSRHIALRADDGLIASITVEQVKAAITSATKMFSVKSLD
jgi:ADP-heptose:LPS heptosyltransferase